MAWNFTRIDYLTARILVCLAAVLYPAVAVVPALVRWIGGYPLVHLGHVPEAGPPVAGNTAPGVTVRYTDEVSWTISSATVGQWLGSLLLPVVTTALIWAGSVIVLRLLARARRDEPFGPGSVRQLRVLAVLIMIYGVVSIFGRGLADILVAGPSTAAGGGVTMASVFTLPTLLPFVIGLLVAALAECFRVGVQLRDDVEGLV